MTDNISDACGTATEHSNQSHDPGHGRLNVTILCGQALDSASTLSVESSYLVGSAPLQVTVQIEHAV